MSPASIFYSPHADDELLSMGVAVLQAVRRGEQVHLVLLTNGAADLTCQCLRGEMDCAWHARRHDPATESFADQPFDKDAFVRARQQEFLRSAEILGVPQERIRLFRFPDGALPQEQVRRIALEYEDDPTIDGPKSHHTMSHVVEWHADHIAAGRALEQLWREGRIAPPCGYVKRSMWHAIQPHHAVQDIAAAGEEERAILRRAAVEAYSTYDPARGFYAIGRHSVPESFDSLLGDMRNRRHGGVDSHNPVHLVNPV